MTNIFENTYILEKILQKLCFREKITNQRVCKTWRSELKGQLQKQTTIGVQFIPSQVQHISANIRNLYSKGDVYPCYNCDNCYHLASDRDLIDVRHIQNPIAWSAIVSACPNLESVDMRGADVSANAAFVKQLFSLKRLACLHVCSARFTIGQWLELCRKENAGKMRHINIDNNVVVVNPQNGQPYTSCEYFCRFLDSAKWLQKLSIILFHTAESIVKSRAFLKLPATLEEIAIYKWECGSENTELVVRRLTRSAARNSIKNFEYDPDSDEAGVTVATVDALLEFENLRCLSLALSNLSFASFVGALHKFRQLEDLTLDLKNVTFEEIDGDDAGAEDADQHVSVDDVRANCGIKILKLVDAQITAHFCRLIVSLVPASNFLKLVNPDLWSTEGFYEWISDSINLCHLFMQCYRISNFEPRTVLSEFIANNLFGLREFAFHGCISSASTVNLLCLRLTALDSRIQISELSVDDNQLRGQLARMSVERLELMAGIERLGEQNEWLRVALVNAERTHGEQIDACKRMLWCVVCQREAEYHCCPYAHYCSESCQLYHWNDGHRQTHR